MSSTPLSGNAIRGPNGAHSPSNKTNPQLLDMSWAASLAGDQHTIVFWLILFVYMKTQRIVSPHCAAKPDTLWYIIECWLRILFLNDKLCSEARSGLGCLVKYFFTSVCFFLFFLRSVQLLPRLNIYCTFSLRRIQMCLLWNIIAA